MPDNPNLAAVAFDRRLVFDPLSISAITSTGFPSASFTRTFCTGQMLVALVVLFELN